MNLLNRYKPLFVIKMLVKEKSNAAWQVRGTGQIHGKEFGVYQVRIGTLGGMLNLIPWKAIFCVPLLPAQLIDGFKWGKLLTQQN